MKESLLSSRKSTPSNGNRLESPTTSPVIVSKDETDHEKKQKFWSVFIFRVVRNQLCHPLRILLGLLCINILFLFNFEFPQFHFHPKRTSPSVATPPVIEYNNQINAKMLILTPMKNEERVVAQYFKHIQSFSYPKHLLSLGILVGDSNDHTYAKVKHYFEKLRQLNLYNRLTIIRKDFAARGLDRLKQTRHDLQKQVRRRSNLARARNYLLMQTLREESFVFWMDADVAEIPSDILQVMVKQDKPILAANCMLLGVEKKRPYDLNSWIETDQTLKVRQTIPSTQLLPEGYRLIVTHRKRLDELRSSPDRQLVVELNGVGGTALLVKSKVHKEGAFFPTFVYNNVIETEGLCRVAEDMGYKCYGMPNLETGHY